MKPQWTRIICLLASVSASVDGYRQNVLEFCSLVMNENGNHQNPRSTECSGKPGKRGPSGSRGIKGEKGEQGALSDGSELKRQLEEFKRKWISTQPGPRYNFLLAICIRGVLNSSNSP